MIRAVRDQIYQRAQSPPSLSQNPRSRTLITFTLTLFLVSAFAALPALRPAWMPAAFQNGHPAGTQAASALIAAFVCAIALHEFGHFAAAVTVNFQILGIALGPFRVARLYGKSIVNFRPRNLFGGSISAIARGERSWRARILTVIAAGPLATLISGIIALAVVPTLQPASWTHSFLGCLAQLSFLIFLLGLIPNGKYARMRNDAQLFWSILRNGTEAHATRLYHRLMRLHIEGIRPRDYPPALVEDMSRYQGRADLALAFAGALTRWATDCRDFAMAHAWQQKAVRLLPAAAPPQRNFARAEWACFELLFADDPQRARSVLSAVRPQEIAPDWRRHRVRAAKYVAEGNAPAASREIDSALLCLPGGIPYSGFERDLLYRLAARLT